MQNPKSFHKLTNYGYGYGNRQLSQFVWTNHDLKQWGTDTVLVTTGSHE